MKQNLLVQQNHFEDYEKKFNVDRMEREVQLRQREEEVAYNLQRNQDILRQLEVERNGVDSKLRV